MTINEILAEVKASGNITGADVLAARRAVYATVQAIPQTAIDGLFALEEASHTSDPGWETLLSEATVDYLVHQAEPEGFVDEAKAGWLLDRIVSDGAVKTVGLFECLIRVLEEARSAPASLAVFALRQVRAAVIDGRGPLAGMEGVDPGRVTREEAIVLRRILYALGSQGSGAISRDEADVIFDINDASLGADNDPEWSDLFVKAVANCIMAASGYVPPPREVALAEERWLNTPDAGVTGFVTDIAVGGLRTILEAYREPRRVDWSKPKPASKDEGGEAVTKDEAEWLAERIARDGRLDPNEKALLRLIGEQAPFIHPTLRELIVRAA